ncbi:hypothetical protein AMELA_G00267520 [Ameiurus melas]|uniref:Bulb-type lectin domain-containing protein n=1 Tax=Ameiurus melas TaxID=219545 RepID=A0A7J5ZPZ0_AMEME|nr:hypothetical protein AMELA_G00267520 [Ameiurus melas]
MSTEELLIDIYYYFEKRSKQREDLKLKNSRVLQCCPAESTKALSYTLAFFRKRTLLLLSFSRTMSRNFLSMNSELKKGDFLISNNGEYKAVFQEDGNFVVYEWKPIWQSNTSGSTAKRLIMQEDCNLVMYDDGPGLWHTNTHHSQVKVCRLTLRNDGILVVENDGKSVWKSSKK